MADSRQARLTRSRGRDPAQTDCLAGPDPAGHAQPGGQPSPPSVALLGRSFGRGRYRNGGHSQSKDDWRTLVDFADKIFFGKTPASGKVFDKLPFADAPKPFSWSAPKSK